MEAKQVELSHCDQCGGNITTFEGQLNHSKGFCRVTLKICKCWFIFIDHTNGVFISGGIKDFLTKQPQKQLAKLILKGLGGD